jgi:hypothetical protein
MKQSWPLLPNATRIRVKTIIIVGVGGCMATLPGSLELNRFLFYSL